MKPVTKSLTKGLISSVELVQGLVVGILIKNLYEKICDQRKEENGNVKHRSNSLFILMYVFILMSSGFMMREINKLLFKNLIVSSMNYKTFAWPPPITFGLGLMFFQDHLKDGIKKEINYLTQQQ